MPKDWTIPAELQPQPGNYAFNLDAALNAVVALRATAPADAFTAGALGTEREGSGVVIGDDGLVLTIGYLITEAEDVWITTAEGRSVPGHALAFDAESGFGLVQPLGRLPLPKLELGDSDAAALGEPVLFASAGGRRRAMETRVVGRQEFAGYWEYLLDDAIFTAPAHPFWGGGALIDRHGKLVGIGSLSLQQGDARGNRMDMNMIVPIDLLRPILGDLRSFGQVNRPPQPWLGLYAMEDDERVVIGGVADGGPADQAGLRQGDQVLAVDEDAVSDLAGLWRLVRGRGPAGARVMLSVQRDSRRIRVPVATVDRRLLLKTPRMH
ncbi:MAG: serine protease [Proteobacteria bacterium]|nr:serine protease [Pseudomonadota bacterium]